MKLFLIIVSCLFFYNVNANCETSVLDIVFVLDESGSIDSASYSLAKQAIYKMINSLNVNPNKIHAGLIRYSTSTVTVRTLVSTDQDKASLLNYINTMNQLSGMTATGDALNEANRIFTRWGRTVTPRIAIVLTDGESNSGSSVFTASDSLKASNVKLFSIGVGNYVNYQELTYMASEPKSRYLKLVNDYNALVTAINEITKTTCGTNAIIQLGEIVYVTADMNEVRYFETNLPYLTYGERFRMIFSYYVGYTVFSYSFTDPNPISFTANYSGTVTKDESGLTKAIFEIYVPSTAKVIYYSFKSLAFGENKYNFQFIKYSTIPQ